MSLAERMLNLFRGMDEAHGVYLLNEEEKEAEEGEKQTGTAFTKRAPVTVQLWHQHLKGEEPLGIIPINRHNMCVWGAIDIDSYQLDLKQFAQKIYSAGLPLFPCRSKSGGCHLVLFLKEPVAAGTLQVKLAEISAFLGFGQSEIFPKQRQVLVEKGDMGNWLNMPYFGGDRSNRYCLDKNGKAMKLAVFLKMAEEDRITEAELENIQLIPLDTDLGDGPPCLQCLISQGFPEGTRNNGLFNLGVYCRKAFPDEWASKVDEFNGKYMSPPLLSREVQSLTKQLDKKDYQYKCNDQPLAGFCNISVCRTRPFGIGGAAMPLMTALRKIPTDQPVWFLQVNDTTLELSTDELQVQGKFQKACMNAMNYMPPKISERQWRGIIQSLLDKCHHMDKPEEASISDQFFELVQAFCTDMRLQAQTREELLLGRPFEGLNPDNMEIKCVFFRLRDLIEFTVRNGFKYYTRSQASAQLQGERLMAKQKFLKIKGVGVNAWYIDFHIFEAIDEAYELPDMGGEDVL
jgi:hypothetical protein|tara:strand:- start:1971 stop:3521 length:1551 start_codon:yes stop_codon:yes gene_type:complete